MVDLTDDIVLVAKALQKIIEDNKRALGIKDVFYGDQDRIPRSPGLCVETGETNRELNGAPRRVLVKMTVYLLVYHNALKAGAAGQREENDALAKAVQTEIHKNENKDLGGLIIHGYCTNAEMGYLQKQDSLWQVTRITHESTSQVLLPYS